MSIVTALRSTPVLAFLLVLSALPLAAQQSNSVVVQTFTYGSSPNGKFVLPPLSERYEKVLMHYKLRCPFDAQCGEWDYLMYIYLHDHTGIIDSTADTSMSYRVDGISPDSIPFMRTPSWRYFPRFQYDVTRTAATSLDSAAVGAGVTPFLYPFNGFANAARSQYVWRSEELAAAGLKAGKKITGIRFNVETPGSELRDLTIRLKGTMRDSVTTALYDVDGFTTVYRQDTRFNSAGWVVLEFPFPYTWTGDSNLVVDISFNNVADGGTSTTVLSTIAPPFPAGIGSTGFGGSRHFEGVDYIEVPKQAFADVDSAVTIAFWAYGTPQYQPQDQSVFEGANADGGRVLNVHLPWSDSLIYWDAGNNTGYDRVSKKARSIDFEGRWNHWAFVKSVKSGTMRIYLNGTQWTSSSSKRKRMNGIETFKIGANWSGTGNYDGDIDELSVWNAELDVANIRGLMAGSISTQHPLRANLRVYYKFDESGGKVAVDSSGRGNHGLMVGPPASRRVAGADLYHNFFTLPYRPNVVFEQGEYGTAQIDTVVTADSAAADPMQVVRYKVLNGAAVPTDTMTVWPAYWNRYSFNKAGRALDSSRVAPDSVMHLVRTPYFRRFERIDRYELGRYITPYGNGLNLGEGFTWTYDVSDFRTLLHDTVYLSAYNQQELVDMTFEFVPGTPPRDPISVRNLWNGGFPYGHGSGIESYLAPLKIKVPENAANSRVKITPTGHGFGGNENCAEFCPKEHSINVNGTRRFEQIVWRDDCGLNPVFPQGGTWVYNRTNWCPGAEVGAYNFELSPWVTPGDSVTLDYNVSPYTWNGQGSAPYYQIETQLITYGAPNFTLDAAVDRIKSPSTTDLYRRMNPICANPIITIKNTGSTTLTSLDIQYGVEGAPMKTQQWTGSLGFLESMDVQLGAIEWAGASAPKFKVTVSNPNGGQDQYANNNTAESAIKLPTVFPSKLIFDLRTNAQPEENSYRLIDLATGNVVWERKDLEAETVYQDTLTLPDGCYEFKLEDLGGDGMNWWANPDAGAGSMRIRRGDNGGSLRTYNNGDFGSRIYEQFTVGLSLISDVPATPGAVGRASTMQVRPNPTTGEFTIDLAMQGSAAEGEITVTNMIGTAVYRSPMKNVASGLYMVDLRGVPAGAYMVVLRAGGEMISQKIVVR